MHRRSARRGVLCLYRLAHARAALLPNGCRCRASLSRRPRFDGEVARLACEVPACDCVRACGNCLLRKYGGDKRRGAHHVCPPRPRDASRGGHGGSRAPRGCAHDGGCEPRQHAYTCRESPKPIPVHCFGDVGFPLPVAHGPLHGTFRSPFGWVHSRAVQVEALLRGRGWQEQGLRSGCCSWGRNRLAIVLVRRRCA